MKLDYFKSGVLPYAGFLGREKGRRESGVGELIMRLF